MAESKITKTPIQHKPWKVKFSPKISEPNVGLYSIFDLLFYEVTSDNVTVIKKRLNNQPSQSKGFRLNHDLICYNTNFMNNVSVDRSLSSSYEEWSITGFDLGFVRYDTRSKTRNVKVKSASGKTFDVRIFDKSAALFPDNVEDLFDINTEYSSLIKRDILSRGDADNSTWQSTNYVPFSVNIDSSSERTTDIFLTNVDSVFTQTLITKSGYSAYNGLCLNTTDDIRYFINCLIGFNSGYIKYDNKSFTYDEERYDNAGLDIFNIQQSSAKNIVFDEVDASNNNAIIDVLKHTYVWLRCGYFGDYINPDDFNQNLDQKADVKFSNLMISSKGDFNRYDDRLSDNKKYKSESTRPYLAQTAPSEDLLSQRIAENAGIKNYDQEDFGEIQDNNGDKIDKSISSQVQSLMKASENEDTSIIGSLWNEALSRDSDVDDNDAEVEAANHLSPPQYFDPEQVKSAITLEHSEHVPVLVPKSGNIMTEGRIISPTIDEIWVYFKKLVSGHASDVENESIVNADSGLIVSNTKRKNENDTRIKEGKELVFNGEYIKDVSNNDIWINDSKGDPIELEIVESEDNKKDRLVVKNWVAAPDNFRYAIYEFLKAENDVICKFEKDYDDGDFKVYHSIFDTTASLNNQHYDQNDQENNTHSVKDGNLIHSNSSNLSEDNENKSSDIYSPRSNPYSLRELEAEIKNAKFNLNTLMRYLVANFTINSQLSKKQNIYGKKQKTIVYKKTLDNSVNGSSYFVDEACTIPFKRHLLEEPSFIGKAFNNNDVTQYSVIWSDIDYTNRQGSGLYQFHRDYNSKIDDPNTWFTKYPEYRNINGKEVPFGNSAVFDDKELDSFDQHNNATLYGEAATLPDSSADYSSSDVYLAADGTWRYVFDHVRIPVLDCDY